MANVLTGIRILCGLLILVFPAFSKWYYGLFLLGGLTDAIDGTVARKLKKESDFGAKFDTAADLVFAVSVIIKTLCFVVIPLWLLIWILCIAIIKCINIIRGFVISGRFISEHTVMNKICGVLLFVIPFCIGRFPWQSSAVLIVLTCVMATVAAIQEGHYIRTGKEVK